jgi:hypothetical protein
MVEISPIARRDRGTAVISPPQPPNRRPERKSSVGVRESLSKKAATQASTQEVPPSLLPDNAPNETLLKTFAGYNDAFERVDAGMQDIVDILHDREVIGQVLAVSRRRHGNGLDEVGRWRAA